MKNIGKSINNITTVKTIFLIGLCVGFLPLFVMATGTPPTETSAKREVDPLVFRKVNVCCANEPVTPSTGSERQYERKAPLAIMKGNFFAKEEHKKVPIRLSVTEKKTRQKQHFIFNPDTLTGSYLIFLPQNRTYELCIEPEGYRPHVVQVHIPDYTYSYEFNRDLSLEALRISEKVIGKKVSVVRSSYKFVQIGEMINRSESEPYYDALALLTEVALAKADTSILRKLPELTKPLPTIEPDTAETDTHYEELLKNIDSAIVKGDPNYIQRIKDDSKTADETFYAENSFQGEVLAVQQLFFDKNASEPTTDHLNKLQEVLKVISNEDKILVEITGFADADGLEAFNKYISERRALNVLRYFRQKKARMSNLIVQGLGSSYLPPDKKANRRVDVKIFRIRK